MARQLKIDSDGELLNRLNESTSRSYAAFMSSYEQEAFDMIAEASDVKNSHLLPDIFRLPFDLDFESQNSYLNAMKKPLFDLSSDLASVTGGQAQTKKIDLAKAYLQLSDGVVAKLGEPNIQYSVEKYSVDSREFCKLTHISYEQLGELLHLNTIDSAARKYVAAIGSKNFYVNKDSLDRVLKLTLKDKSSTESLQHLTEDRLKRIGLFHFMSKKLGIDYDELELLFLFLGIGSNISEDNILELALLRKLQKENNLSTITLINMLVDKTRNEILYGVVMENIRPVTGPMEIWELHWKLLPAYLMLLSSTETEGIDAALTRADRLLSEPGNALFLGYTDVSSNLGSTTPQKHDYFTYYANQTLTYLSRVSGVTVEEIRTICLKTPALLPTTQADVDSFIQSIYTLGHLKKSYNRTLVELCQLACFTNAEAVAPKTADDVIAQGIPLLLPNKFDKFLSNPSLPQHSGPFSVQFLLAPVSQDIFVILKSGTASTNVEVHVLSAMSGYRSFSGSFVTSFPSSLCSPGTEFLLAKNNDIYIVLKSGSDIQVHRLSANDQYRNSTTIVQKRLYDNKLNLVMCCGSAKGQFMLSPDTSDLYFVYKSPGGDFAHLYAFFFKDPDHANADNAPYAHQKHGFISGIPACGAEAQFFLRPNNDIGYALRKAVGDGSTDTAKSELHIFREKDGLNMNYKVADLRTATFFNMFGPECQFLLGKNGDLLHITTSTTDNRIAITAVSAKNYHIQASLTNNLTALPVLLKLNTFNQIAVDQSWDLDDLILSRFGVLSPIHQQQVTDIRQSLLQPFFRGLTQQESAFTTSDVNAALTYSTLDNKSVFVTQQAHTDVKVPLLDGVIVNPLLTKPASQSLTKTSVKQQLMTEKSVDMLETNVAKLFSLDDRIFHRLMTSFDDLGCSFYCKLIFSQEEKSIESIDFIRRIMAIINLFNLQPSINESSRSQFESIIMELNAAVQKLVDDEPQIDNLSSSDSNHEFFSSLSQKVIDSYEERLIPQNLKKFFENLIKNLKDLINTDVSTLDLSRLKKAAAVFYQAKSIDFDDIDVLIALLNFSSSQDTSKMLESAMSNEFLEKLMSYKKSQMLNGDRNASLLQCFYGEVTEQDHVVLSDFLQISRIDWNNFKPILFANTTTSLTSLSLCIGRLDQITSLKSLLTFFGYDTTLVTALLNGKSPKFISQQLSQVLQRKNSDAYENATRSLNERKRDVLVDAVLRTFHADPTYDCFKLDNPDKLSEYLLIDVSISGEDKQTPIIQAHSTLQWYMRRCVERVEQDDYRISSLMTVDIPDAWWSWIQNYRLWEANRKVFLYPENFLSPDLRVNQSEQFQQLSKTLRGPHLDDDSIETAYLQYVSDLMRLRDITISAACAEPSLLGQDRNPITKKIHLFGHDNATPKQYYHCTTEKYLIDYASDFEFLSSSATADIYVVQKSRTRSGKIEISVLLKSADPAYSKTCFFETKIPVIENSAVWKFCLGENNNLYCILQDLGQSGKVELYKLLHETEYSESPAASKVETVLDAIKSSDFHFHLDPISDDLYVMNLSPGGEEGYATMALT